MGCKSNLTKRGSELKRYILDNMIDKQTGVKISDRQFMHTYWSDIGGSTKSTGSLRYHFTSDEIKKSEPYYGETISEALVYKYAVDNKIISPVAMPFEEFSKKSLKVTNDIDEGKILREVANELDYPFKPELFTINQMWNTLKYIHGDKYIEKLRDIKIKQKKGGVRK